MVKTIGSSDNKQKVEALFHQGQQWIKNHSGQIELDFLDEKQLFSKFTGSIQQITVVGSEVLLVKIFDKIGFNKIQDELFTQLVIERLCFPLSKLKTT